MSGKKRRWPAETNLAALKTLAHTLLWFDIQPTKLSPLVVKHPFTDSGLVGIRNEDGSLSAGNLLDDPGALQSWRENVRQQINEAETARGAAPAGHQAVSVGLLELAAPYLCEQDAAPVSLVCVDQHRIPQR